MNKIVREHYPASKLPADLRAGVDPSSMVTVTIAVEGEPTRTRMSIAELLEKARSAKPTDDDPVERIRELRNEWGD